MSVPSITRIQPRPPRGLRVRVHLTAGEPSEVSLGALERSRLGVGDDLSPNARHHLLNADADVQVRDAALNLLSFRARTRSELRQKLRGKGFRPARIDLCLDLLEEKGFLDDAAVAASFVRDRLNHRPRGPARLNTELRAKGVEGDLAENVVKRVMEEQEVSERDLAVRVAEGWLKRQGPSVRQALGSASREPDTEKARRRLYGFLTRRGFRGDALRVGMERVRELAGEGESS
jgi:regulatory protein